MDYVKTSLVTRFQMHTSSRFYNAHYHVCHTCFKDKDLYLYLTLLKERITIGRLFEATDILWTGVLRNEDGQLMWAGW